MAGSRINMLKKRVAITGATGFLGQHVVQAISDAGHIPIAVVRDAVRARHLLPEKIEIRQADILDEQALISAIRDVDMAIHLAGMVSVNKCDYEKMLEINIDGARNFLNAINKANLKRAIFTSTTSAVGALNQNDTSQALTENAAFNLENQQIGYIKSKRAAHLLALTAQDEGLPLIILSPSFVLGPNDINLNTSALIEAIRHHTLPIYPNGGINPIDVRDVAKSFVEVINHSDPNPHYILASEENMSLKSFVSYVAKRAFVSPPLLSLPNFLVTSVAKIIETLFPRGELTADAANMGRFFWYFNAALARQDLLLNCRPLDETINATLSWLENHEMEQK